MKEKKSLQEIIYVVFLLIAIVILFHWYTTQSRIRIEERNKNYAADSAWQTAVKINEELNNALDLIKTYTYFIGESLTEPVINPQMLADLEKNSMFDACIYTDADGRNYASDGRTTAADTHEYFLNGIKGEDGITVVFDSDFFDETMVSFYAPVRYEGDIIGVLRGTYLAEEYLKDMLATTYFGEAADVYLCMPDGQIVASSNGNESDVDLLDMLTDTGVIDMDTAKSAREILTNGGRGAFVCSSDSKTDNICVMALPDSKYFLVQTFPKSVTQTMIRDENIVGVQLEAMLIGLFAVYVVILLIRAGREKKLLEAANREMGYIINGVSTLFPRFAMADFEENTYQYLSGTRPENDALAIKGDYEQKPF